MNLSVPAVLLYSLAGASIIAYLPVPVMAYARAKVGFDLAAPRALFDKLPDYGKRATWAHANSFESLIIYTAAVLVAYLAGVDTPSAAWAALVYLLARLLYVLFYIFNVAVGRSLMFGIGLFCTIGLFVAGFIDIN